ncbi:MAG: hypothetical protein J5U17_10910 [Candidatus Methanoperedens sp.]|nr:hypothetical protein [Candidatus Methanoperedens sp.]
MSSSNRSVYFLESNDAVAEVLDFVTILGILMLAFSMIALAGYPILRSAQETRYIENTRQSFVVMADNLNKIALGQSPSQSVELKIYSGTLSTSMDSSINITAKNSTGQMITLVDQNMGNIQNSIGDTVVAYEGTGVWVKYPNGHIFNAYRPLITNRSNILVIPIVVISGNTSVGGTGIARLKADGTPGITSFSNVTNLTMTISGNYVSGWKDYLGDIMDLDDTPDSKLVGHLNSTKLDVYILRTAMYTEIE